MHFPDFTFTHTPKILSFFYQKIFMTIAPKSKYFKKKENKLEETPLVQRGLKGKENTKCASTSEV